MCFFCCPYFRSDCFSGAMLILLSFVCIWNSWHSSLKPCQDNREAFLKCIFIVLYVVQWIKKKKKNKKQTPCECSRTYFLPLASSQGTGPALMRMSRWWMTAGDAASQSAGLSGLLVFTLQRIRYVSSSHVALHQSSALPFTMPSPPHPSASLWCLRRSAILAFPYKSFLIYIPITIFIHVSSSAPGSFYSEAQLKPPSDGNLVFFLVSNMSVWYFPLEREQM